MCDACGCGDPKRVPVVVQENILARNDEMAEHLREHFRRAGVLAINVMGSPGSGKTALLEATSKACGDRLRIGAVSGDLATERDAERLRAAGIESLSITTGSACHLDADMVHDALHAVDWRHKDLFFIENVGNLVCPAVYDLGQAVNVVVLSVTEGEDKPLKYPLMFRKADIVVLSKVDLVAVLETDTEAIKDNLEHVMPNPRMIHFSARSGEGLEEWVELLYELLARRPKRVATSRV